MSPGVSWAFGVGLTAFALGWSPASTPLARSCERATPLEVENVVQNAADLIERVGLRAALPQILDPRGDYRRGELYVFVLDRRGILWANAVFPSGVGQDILDSRDAKGRYFVKEILRVAKRRGRGWVAYEWIDPCTGGVAEKQTYVQRTGDFVVAAGLYRALRA